jgi:hypothetical protein
VSRNKQKTFPNREFFYVYSIIALEERIEQQSQQLNDLNEKNATLSSQLESQADQLNREK